MTKLSPLIDPFNRKITYLRVSVTDRCDFRCVYCMSEKMQFLPKKDLLTLEEFGLSLERISESKPLPSDFFNISTSIIYYKFF